MVIIMRVDFILNEMLKKLEYTGVLLESTVIKDLDKNGKNHI